MSRRSINADGTISVQSMSYFGTGDADEYYRKEWESINEYNRKALEVWNSLTPEEQAARTEKFLKAEEDYKTTILQLLNKT